MKFEKERKNNQIKKKKKEKKNECKDEDSDGTYDGKVYHVECASRFWT